MCSACALKSTRVLRAGGNHSGSAELFLGFGDKPWSRACRNPSFAFQNWFCSVLFAVGKAACFEDTHKIICRKKIIRTDPRSCVAFCSVRKSNPWWCGADLCSPEQEGNVLKLLGWRRDSPGFNSVCGFR